METLKINDNHFRVSAIAGFVYQINDYFNQGLSLSIWNNRRTYTVALLINKNLEMLQDKRSNKSVFVSCTADFPIPTQLFILMLIILI